MLVSIARMSMSVADIPSDSRFDIDRTSCRGGRQMIGNEFVDIERSDASGTTHHVSVRMRFPLEHGAWADAERSAYFRGDGNLTLSGDSGLHRLHQHVVPR